MIRNLMGVQVMEIRKRCFGLNQMLAMLMTLLLAVQVVMPLPLAWALGGESGGESTSPPESVQLTITLQGYDDASFAIFSDDTTPVSVQKLNGDNSIWAPVGSRVTAFLTTYHQNGNWHYWFSKTVTESGTWVLDDNFSARVELSNNNSSYLVGHQLQAELYIHDSQGNRLEAVLDESKTGPGEMGGEVAHLSVWNQAKEQIVAIKKDQPDSGWSNGWFGSSTVSPVPPSTTFFGADYTITPNFASGQYTAELELLVAPETTISGEAEFTIINENAVPVLQVEPGVLSLEQQVFSVSGMATPGATVVVSYRLSDEEPTMLADLIAGQDGKFGADYLPAPAVEGIYTFTAVGILGEVQSEPSQPVTMIVDRTPPTVPVLDLVSYSRGGLANLVWQPATDNFGVVSYKVFRALDEEPAVEIAEVPVTSPDQPLIYQDAGLLAETSYTYSLRAVDEAGNQSALSTPIAITTDPIFLDSVGYQLSTAAGRIDLAQINQGAKLIIKLVGEAGRIASADINYLSLLDESGQPLETPRAATATVTLAESLTLPETYLGEFTITNNITEILSITGKLADTAGHEAIEMTAIQLQVTGSLQVNLAPADIGQLTNYQLLVHSTSTGQGSTQRITVDAATYTFSGLRPASDYTVRLLDTANRQVGSWPVTLQAGQLAEMTLPAAQPARLRVQVQDPAGKALSGQRVSFWHNSSRAQATAITDAQGWAEPNLLVAAGDEVGVTVTLSGEALALPCPDQQGFDLAIAAGINEKMLQLKGLATVTVQGKVLPPTEAPALPLADTSVSAVQMIGTRSISTTTTTDAVGNYTLQVPWGKIALSAATADAKYVFDDETNVPAEGLSKNLQLSTIGKADIKMTVRTRFLEQESGVVQNLDWRSAFYFYFNAQDAYGWSYQSYPLNLFAEANDTVTIRVDGSEQGLPMVEHKVKLDSERKGEVEFYLEEQGRIVGSVLDENGAAIDLQQLQSLRVIVFTVDEQGKQTFLMQRKLVDNNFKISVPQPGKYTVQVVYEPTALRTTQYIATVGPFDVGLYEIKNLGAVRVAGADATTMRGALMATPAEVAPGSVLTMWAELSATENWILENAKLSLALPAGCQMVPGSFTTNGQPLEADGPSFSLGDIELLKNQRQILNWQVQVAADIKGTDLLFFADLDWSEGGKQWHRMLVPANVKIAQLTLDTPAILQRLTTTLNGRGPVGATVKVYNEKLLLGQTQVSPAGYWRLPVVLPNRGTSARYQLHAVANLGEKEWHSQARELLYDSRQVVLQQVILRQDEGNQVFINPADGVALFPYVINIGEGEFEVTLKFNHPDLIQRASVSIKPFTAEAQREGNDFVAKIPFKSWDLGGLYVHYETKPNLEALQRQAPTEQVWRQQLPILLRGFEGNVLADQRSVGYVVPGLPGTEGSLELDLKEVVYTPTEDDLKFERETGLPIYGLELKATPSPADADGKSSEYIIEVEAYIPKELIENPGFRKMSGLRAAGGAKAVIRIATRIVKKAGPDGALNAIDWTGALIDGFGVPDKFDELGNMLDTATSCGGASAHYREQIDQMSMMVMGGEVAKWGLQLAGVFLAPETFGIGTILLFGASKGVEYALDKHIERAITGLKADMKRDIDCKFKDDDDPAKKIADPRWIFDPSGNVYEGVFENPLENVLATVFEKVERDGKTVMIPWDAEWYGQINPQLTDAAGYYGWDVPKGEWQVVYEKEGYLTAKSNVMTVPPPRTGVNINLQSLAAPAIASVAAAAGGTHIDFTFDKYMLAGSLSAGTISVIATTEDGEEFVAGQASVVDPVPNSAEPTIELCRKARFTPKVPLIVGATYTVQIGSAVQSYAGIPMGGAVEQTVMVPEVVPPVGDVTNASAVAGNRTLAITWTDPAAANLSKIKLAWKARGAVEYQGTGQVTKGTQSYTISGLVNGAEYEVLLTTLDNLGNESAGVKLWSTPRALVIDPPIVDPPVIEPPDKESPVIKPPDEEIPDPGSATEITVELDGEQQTVRGLDPEIVLSLPSGAFAAGTQFSVHQLPVDEQQLAPEMNFASAIYTLDAGGAVPAKPLPITLPYNANLLGNADARLLGVYRQDAVDPSQWHYVGGVLNATHQRLTLQIDKLGNYAVILNRPVFNDVVGHWARGDVTILAARHLVAGIGSGKFDPDRPITRVELVTLLARLMKYDPFLELKVANKEKAAFADVPANAWYWAVLQTCVRMGVVKASDKNFRPNEPATREEMAVMMLRAMEAMGEPRSYDAKQLPFKDKAKISAAALDEVTRAWNKGLMRGVSADLFSPEGTSTRAQAATVMLRMLQSLGMVTSD